MKLKVDLKAKPFYLNDSQIAWVSETLEKMDLNAKIGQLFFPSFMTKAEENESAGLADDKKLAEYDALGLQPCGVLFRRKPAAEIRDCIAKMQNRYDIPLLIAGDLERGASAMMLEGTMYGHNMSLAATDDPEIAYRAGYMCAEESAATGANWNFGPVTDLDFNEFSPITNVRTFGSDVERVIAFSTNIARGMRDGGMIPCAKHWPGDGVDSRDQHFVTSVNTMTCEEWDATYGRVYQAMIDDGVETVMTAHINLPCYTRYFNPNVKDEDMLPASLSYELNIQLLREKLGFNGVIITDATSMVGFTEVLPRSVAVPTSIANGADIFLFNRNLEEDLEYMKKGIEDGILTEERIDEAVTRILALKAKINLHEKKANGTIIPPVEKLEMYGSPERIAFAKEVADKSITLVKDVQDLLPLNIEKHKKIYVIPIGDDKPNYHTPDFHFCDTFVAELKDRGFDVTVYDDSIEQKLFIGGAKIEDLKKEYDVICYFVNICTSGSDSATRITWPGIRVTLPAFINDLPVMMVSIDYPYCLMDAPRMKTYINGYTSSKTVVETIVEKICGESEFKGISPVDAFTKFPNTRY